MMSLRRYGIVHFATLKYVKSFCLTTIIQRQWNGVVETQLSARWRRTVMWRHYKVNRKLLTEGVASSLTFAWHLEGHVTSLQLAIAGIPDFRNGQADFIRISYSTHYSIEYSSLEFSLTDESIWFAYLIGFDIKQSKQNNLMMSIQIIIRQNNQSRQGPFK